MSLTRAISGYTRRHCPAQALPARSDEILRAPQLLRDTPDLLFKSYVLKYLTEGESSRDPDKTARVLAGLLPQETLSVRGRAATADWLASNFHYLGEGTHPAITEALVAAANAENANVSRPALSALLSVADQKLLDLKPVLTATRQRKIAENYRAFRAQNPREQEHPEFELQIGVRR